MLSCFCSLIRNAHFCSFVRFTTWNSAKWLCLKQFEQSLSCNFARLANKYSGIAFPKFTWLKICVNLELASSDGRRVLGNTRQPSLWKRSCKIGYGNTQVPLSWQSRSSTWVTELSIPSPCCAVRRTTPLILSYDFAVAINPGHGCSNAVVLILESSALKRLLDSEASNA